MADVARQGRCSKLESHGSLGTRPKNRRIWSPGALLKTWELWVYRVLRVQWWSRKLALGLSTHKSLQLELGVLTSTHAFVCYSLTVSRRILGCDLWFKTFLNVTNAWIKAAVMCCFETVALPSLTQGVPRHFLQVSRDKLAALNFLFLILFSVTPFAISNNKMDLWQCVLLGSAVTVVSHWTEAKSNRSIHSSQGYPAAPVHTSFSHPKQ